MKRNKNLITLSHDHFHGLMLAQLLKKGAPPFKDLPNDIQGKADYAIKFYRDELLKHFYSEEEVLYPLVKGKLYDVDVLFEEAVAEHRKIAKLVEEISGCSALENHLNELGELLESHIRKEEKILFMKIQEILPENVEIDYLSSR